MDKLIWTGTWWRDGGSAMAGSPAGDSRRRTRRWC
jgi:hypothetical protein